MAVNALSTAFSRFNSLHLPVFLPSRIVTGEAERNSDTAPGNVTEVDKEFDSPYSAKPDLVSHESGIDLTSCTLSLQVSNMDSSAPLHTALNVPRSRKLIFLLIRGRQVFLVRF